MRRLFTLVTFAATITTTASAQLVTQKSLSNAGAMAALTAAQQEAAKQGWRVSIAVVDPTGELLAFTRVDGASYASISTAMGKARTAARFRRPTQAYDSMVTRGRLGLLTLNDMTPLEGGIPIIVEGIVVGAIGVSGVTSAQDAEVARAGAAAVRP